MQQIALTRDYCVRFKTLWTYSAKSFLTVILYVLITSFVSQMIGVITTTSLLFLLNYLNCINCQCQDYVFFRFWLARCVSLNSFLMTFFSWLYSLLTLQTFLYNFLSILFVLCLKGLHRLRHRWAFAINKNILEKSWICCFAFGSNEIFDKQFCIKRLLGASHIQPTLIVTCHTKG